MEHRLQRMKPSELRAAFAIAKARALRQPAAPRIIEFVNADDHTARLSSVVPLQRPLFEPSPAEVWIDEYTPFHSLTIKLSFRNCDSVARRLKIEAPASPLFKILPFQSPHSANRMDGKVAAGMEIAFLLEFSPQEVADLSLDLVCCTERERFALPVRVRGRVAALDIPDDLDFGVCPVKVVTSKVLMVRNVGSRAGKFAFSMSAPFLSVLPESAVLEASASVQLELRMCPPRLQDGVGELTIVNDAGQIVVVTLHGDVRNLDAYLSAPLVEPNATYISLSSRKPIKICNDSEHPLEFAWKAFPTAHDEQLERERLLDELVRMEAAELNQLVDEMSSEDEDRRGGGAPPFDARKMLETKYKHLRRAVLDDAMEFADECFSLTPLSGRVWAHSEVDVVATFSPTMALRYACHAYLEIGGQEGRLPLQIRGVGIGPKAKVVYNELIDFGEVFISDERTRDFTIQNKGEIPAHYELAVIDPPLPASGLTLRVEPSRGTLSVNEMSKVEVSFGSHQLGDVFHALRFRLQGSEEQVVVRVKATVVPPVFRFDSDQLDFGAVSYSFPQVKTVKLVNASKINMRYTLRIPEETACKKKEFEIQPSSGCLDAYGEQELRILFTSMCVKLYDYRLVVNVAGISSDLLALPIKAQSFVPEVVVAQSELDFGASFLRHPHRQTLVLENRSAHLFARFEIVEQDEHSKAIASYTTPERIGVIRPEERAAVEIFLSCEKLGPIRLPMAVTIPGSTDLPLAVTLTAVGTGPRIELDQLEVNWGSCSCLVDHTRVLTMTNRSLIPAPFKTFIRNARSKFSVDVKEGVVAPGESATLVLIANLDDTITFKDQLHILVAEGENLIVPLSVRGTGTTMWSHSELRVIDFGYQMTTRECEWSCTLENKGKRAQLLTWSNRTALRHKMTLIDTSSANAAKKKKAAAGKQTAGNSSAPAESLASPDEVAAVFSVFPATIELKPRTACVFVFKGVSARAGVIAEELVCETRVGKEKNTKVAFVTEVRGHFVDPHLEPSVPALHFEYVHDPARTEIPRQVQPLSLRNACALPLSFTLRTQPPFSLDCWEAELKPGEHVDLMVEFYPGFKDDHRCRVLQGKVAVAYVAHPQRDSVELVGDISFPNLEFETTKIDFGCTLNDTQRSMLVSIRNISRVDTAFRWVFIEDEQEARAAATAKRPYIPVNQVFDILPIRGVLRPGEKENIEFLFYGHANRKFKSLVACEVEGGPEYELTLLGEASSLVYRLDKQCLDFGSVLYNKTEDREFAILNVGKVPFSFQIMTDHVRAPPRSVQVAPMSGKIAPNDKQRILVQLRPGIPEPFEEILFIEVAHFEPIAFKLLGNGIFAAVSLNLPREFHAASTIAGEPPKWRELKKRARLSLESSILSAAIIATGTSNNTGAMSGSDSKTSISTEIEASRLFFAEYLLHQERKSHQSAISATPQKSEGVDVDAEASRAESDNGASQTPAVVQMPKPRGAKSETSSFLLSHFVLDFGFVVLGTHRTKKFSVANIGPTPASFQFDKNLAQSRGFQLDPERVVRLPERQSVEFTVTFQARKNIALGLHSVQLPIAMKNGPPTLVTFRAVVTVPDIALSTDQLDFGCMAVGTSHTMFTQLHNVSTVPAEWAIKKPMGSARDLSYFRVLPSSGTLGPGNKANLQIDFMPHEGRHFSLKLPVKVAANAKTRSLVLRGEGDELRLSFVPPIVELGPVLPCSEPIEHLVELRNESNYAVEVIALDFDTAYKEDEELLRSAQGYGSDDVMQLPLRPPDLPWRSYLEEHGAIPQPQVDTSDSESQETTAREGEASTEPNGAVQEESADVSPNDESLSAPVDPRQAELDAIHREHLAVWTIDEAIEKLCRQLHSALGHAVRVALGIESRDPIAQEGSEEPNNPPAPETLDADEDAEIVQADAELSPESEAPGEQVSADEDARVDIEAETLRRQVDAFFSSTEPSRRLVTSYQDYTKGMEATRYLLARFVARDCKNLLGLAPGEALLAADASEPAPESQEQNATPPALCPGQMNASTFTTMLKTVARADNFALEYAITEVSAPLTLHNALSAAIDKHARELELSHLALPPPQKSQLIRRPAPRFAQEVGVFDASLGFEIVGQPRREFTLFCRATSSVPQINSDPRNVFMSRVKSRSEGSFVSKKFVLSKNVFEFGPLIVPAIAAAPPQSEDDFADLLASSAKNPGIVTHNRNIDTFRISNTSKYALQVDFTLQNQDGDEAAPTVFAFAPKRLELAEGETKDVRVWASPVREGLHEDALICCVSDNPEPVAFALSCYGCTPKLGLRGPWEQPAADTTSEQEPASVAATPVTSPRGDAASPSAVSGPVLDFEKLLLRRQDEKTFLLENQGAIAVTWRVVNPDAIPSDFRIFPLEGVVKPFQQTPVVVSFTAMTEALHKYALQIEFSDADSALRVDERRRMLSLVLQAEAYKIDVCSFESDSPADASPPGTRDGSLDFGLVRVGESHSRSFNIRNRGKYDIKFALTLRSPMARELFHVEPVEQVLAPDSVAQVRVTFQARRHEVTLKDNKDIKCTIVEMLTREPCADFLVLTSARAVFSAFRLQPQRGISFGALKFSDKPRTKRLEIRNDGEFVFKFRVRCADKSLNENTSPAPALTLESELTPGTLVAGQFTVTPDCGAIDPGTTVSLDVTFQPKDCDVYRELLHVDITGRSTVDAAAENALVYELVGESCFPGINASDVESIFEEQIVVRSLGPDAAMTSNSGATAAATASLLSLQTVVYAEREKVFSFGAMIAAPSGKGCVERFKISNPTKVTTTVQFQITPSPGTANDSGATPATTAAFTVQPAVWEIPPLEHRFVNVHFKPTAILSYTAIFTARVQDAPTQVTPDTVLQFELRGEGTMPCVTILEPAQRDAASGALLVAFDRVRVSKSKDTRLVLRNDGILPATVLFAMAANPNFVFAHGNGSIVISPRVTETLTIQFKPQKAHDEVVSTTLKITVQNNPFEETTVRLSGRGYREDVVLEDLPFGHDDQLHFEDIQLGRDDTAVAPESVRTFTISNQSNAVVRFVWPKVAPFSFSPSVGHLRPRGYRLITAVFSPQTSTEATGAESAVVFKDHKIALQCQRVQLRDVDAAGTANDWDDTMRLVTYDGASDASPFIPEPGFEPEGAPSTVTLSCFAAADMMSFRSSVSAIAFKRTFMLQVCTHKFSLQNTSKISLPFAWRWIRAGTAADSAPGMGLMDEATSLTTSTLAPSASTTSSSVLSRSIPADGAGEDDSDEDCPFDITPDNGVIAAEDSQTFVVRFAPMEVDDFRYELFLDVPSDSSSSAPLRIPVIGSSLRPACHFDVERSDYAQRRAPNRPGPHDELGPLDPSIKVIEMESLGIRVRNTKRFYVVNPTNVSYEFAWTPEGELNPCFRCATPKGLMLAGKRCEMIFEFTPQQLDLQEMFWRFTIPHFQVNQLFLFVGTTTEPRVTLDRGSVNFNTLLIGTKASQSVALLNHEHIPFNFVFDKTALDFGGEAPALLVSPLSGVVPPNGRALIDVEFIPSEEKSYNFNLNCIIKRKPTRLSLNVKGEGYSIHDSIAILDSTTSDPTANDLHAAILGTGNTLEFGAVRVHEIASRHIVISNTGKFNFEFNWSHGATHKQSGVGQIVLPPSLSIEPLQGTVKKNDKVTCRISFAPTKPTTLDTLGPLTCTIAGARHYIFALHGTAVPPSLQFSFTSHDFGPCFIADADATTPQSERVTLTIFNMDAESGVDLDCLFEKKPHLRVDCPPTSVGPRDSVSIPIVFTARQEMSYLELVPFVVNGSTTVSVSIRGEGVAPKVELANSSMQALTFGALQVGQQISRTVKIINRTKRKAAVEIVDGESGHGEKTDDDVSLSSLGINVFPTGELTLKAKESVDVEFRFAPTRRLLPFQRDVFLRVAGSQRRLLTLSGCCQGMDVQLETDTLSFGTVCLGSHVLRKVHLQNRGDVAARFQWNTRAFAPDFMITPVEGVIAPNHHKTFEITFKPTSINPDVRYERLCCTLDGTEPVYLTLVGACVKQTTSAVQDVHFDSRVREELTKTITIDNPSLMPWNLLPVVQGEHWSCPENVAVPAEGKATLTVVYVPLTMTRQPGGDDGDAVNQRRPEQHEGSIFCAVPDGSALVYHLFGKATAPAPVASLSFTTPAKKSLPISIAVTNWLKATQQFNVELTIPQDNRSVIVQGAPSFVVQAGSTRNYHMKFFSFTECVVALGVRFVNPTNGEYLHYDVSVSATRAAEVETLHLEAPVRQSVRKTVAIENPFFGRDTQ
ncbi:hypothetical protein P43SY_009913 [Pythium insidiosum]|uniref:MSP domain-containing protein n=1 Tax=Pythium insidiosum TaxID=114742 RepID=A0AAD5M1K8_PYTIN|nr:hypothetical protein P43SY_009913 [Pythium insidiosum]